MTTCQHYKQQYTELKELHDKLTKGLEDFEIYGKTKNPNIIQELLTLKEELEEKTQAFEEEFREYLVLRVYERFSGELREEDQSLAFKAGGGVETTAFNPDGTAIAVGSDDDKMLRILSTTQKNPDGTPKELLSFKAGGWVRTTAFNHDGSAIAVGSDDDKMLRIFGEDEESRYNEDI